MDAVAEELDYGSEDGTLQEQAGEGQPDLIMQTSTEGLKIDDEGAIDLYDEADEINSDVEGDIEDNKYAEEVQYEVSNKSFATESYAAYASSPTGEFDAMLTAVSRPKLSRLCTVAGPTDSKRMQRSRNTKGIIA